MFLLHMYMEILASCAPQALLVDLLHHSAQFSDVSKYEKQQILGKTNNSNGKNEKASYFADSMSVYVSIAL